MPQRFDSFLKWTIIAAGAVTPWCVGAGMKIYLDRLGEPTWDWLYFLHPGRLLAEIWATLWFAAPSLLLALLAHFLLAGRISRLNFLNQYEKRLTLIISASWGGAASVPVFLEVFRLLDPIVFFFAFLVTAQYIADYVLGLLAGFLLAVTSYAIRRVVSPA